MAYGGWYPLVIITWPNVVDELDRAVLGVFGPNVQRYFGMNDATFGLLVASRSLPSSPRRHHRLPGHIDRSRTDRGGSPCRPPALRTLDEIHPAVALDLGDAVETIVTYVERLREAATANGVVTNAPA